MKLSDLADLPKWQKISILLFVTVVLPLVFYFIFLNPLNKEIKILKEEISKLNSEIEKLRIFKKREKEINSKYRNLKVKYERLSKKLPEEKEVFLLLQQIHKLAKKIGIEITEFTRGDIVKGSNIHFVIPISVRVKGSFDQLGYFFEKLAKMERIVNVKNLKISAGSEKYSIYASFNLNTYMIKKLNEKKK